MNTFSLSTPAKKVVTGNSSQSKGEISSGRRDRKSPKKGCYREILSEKIFGKSGCEQSAVRRERGWEQQTVVNLRNLN